jgi:hypothetical protein
MQMRINELKNQQRIAMELHSTPIYQTADRTIVNNVLSDLRPGDLLTVRDKISPIDTSNRSLQDFVQEERSVITQANSLTFSNDTARGNPLPASTPATNALIADTQTKSVFGFKRQNYDLFLQDYFNEMVLPQLIKDLTPEHIFRFVGSPEELIKLDEMISSRYSNRIFAQKILSSVDVTPEEALEASEQAKMSAIKKLKALGTDRWLKIKENMYNNADFEFDFIITNEQVDPAVIAQNANAALTAIAQNQIDLNNPLARSLFYKYAEAIGINPTELEANRQLVQASPMQSQITQTQPSPEGEQATQGIQGLTQPMA